MNSRSRALLDAPMNSLCRSISRRHFVLASLAGALTLVGCGESTTDKTNKALTPQPGGQKAVGDTGVATATSPAATTAPAAAATTAPSPTVSPSPTAAPKPSPTASTQNLNLVAKGFGAPASTSSYQNVGFALIVENPNQNAAIEGSQYQISAYDEAGTVIETDSGYITVVLPGQKTAVAGDLSISDGKKATRVDMQVLTGKPKAAQPAPTFTVENVRFVASKTSPKVTGIVKSPYQKDIKDIRVSAVAYNDAGEIIGGGFTYLQFVPAGGQAAAEVSLYSSADPAKVELYPALSGLSDL